MNYKTGKTLNQALRQLTKEETLRRNISKHTTAQIYSKIIVELGGDDSNKETIADLYQREVCKLPTETLNFILQTHEEQLMNRAADTISAIISELAEREIMRK